MNLISCHKIFPNNRPSNHGAILNFLNIWNKCFTKHLFLVLIRLSSPGCRSYILPPCLIVVFVAAEINIQPSWIRGCTIMMNSYNVHMFQTCCVNCRLYHRYPATHHFTHHLMSKYHGTTLAQLEWNGYSCAVQEKYFFRQTQNMKML